MLNVGDVVQHKDANVVGTVIQVTNANELQLPESEFDDIEIYTGNWYIVQWNDGIKSNECEKMLITDTQ